MTAAHFAVALAIKGRVPQAHTAGLVVGAFLPDFIWIALATAGIEPTRRDIFFDDWSHSLLSILLLAVIYALCFWKQGRDVMAAMVIAVASHFLLDMPIHPKPLALYPHSSVHMGFGYARVALLTYWTVQLVVTLALLAVYAMSRRRMGLPLRNVIASCALILGWHVAAIPG